jgi:nucleotide-binding universal stress UspA family protein
MTVAVIGRQVMTYRTILVDLTADEQIEARLNVVRFLALRFEAALIGLHVVPPPLDPAVWQGGMSVYIPPELAEAQRKAGLEAKERARAVFDRVCGAEPKAVWREAEGDPGPLLAEAAHTADLVVTARGDMLGTTELLVTAAGVPVLALPPNPPHDVDHVVLVAWKGSREAARAVHDALPFLHTAKRVVLCGIGERAAAGLDDAAAMLERHQVAVHPERVEGTDGRAGEILLAQAAAHEADLLVMGAYGHGRLRELVFGGATYHVLNHAQLPVLFSG